MRPCAAWREAVLADASLRSPDTQPVALEELPA